MQRPKIHSNLVRTLFFLTGIISTLSYRSIVIVNNFSFRWAQFLWYVGTIGFIIYFIHRYKISRNRVELIKEYELDKKIAGGESLSTDEKEAVDYIFNTLKSSKEKWNFVFIFASSLVALILGLYLDFFR
jgi:hypothetical protein